jgi:PTH1 family peptidyl-tRNA hydrolase
MAIDLVLGLGNPGPEYARTRHNMGFAVAAEMLHRRGRTGWIRRFDSDVAVITPGRIVVVARPLHFMNRSGEVAARLLSELDLAPATMLVVVDDIDLLLGSLRLRMSGGPGTHNGLRDICSHVGTGFARLRVGVRGSKAPENLADYVLSPFDQTETALADSVIGRAADAIDHALRHGFDSAMNIFNRPPEKG